MAGKSTISITFKLDSDGKGFKELTKDADGLKVAISSTITESNKMQSSLVKWSMSAQGIEAVSDAVTKLNTVFQGFVKPADDFSKAMKETNTMASKSGEDFEHLKDRVADLSKTVPVARDLLAKGLYQVISNGVPEDNWLTFLESSARSSVGGLADLQKVVTVTSTVIKNYGLEWSDAQAVQDKIQLTAKNGVTSFEQLGEALPRVTGSAANLGVQMNELLAVFATATGVTGNTAEVSTQLSAVLTALQKPSSMAAKAAADMGIQFDAAAVKGAGGLRNFLIQLDASITAYAAKTGTLKETIYAHLFGSAESLRLLTSLTGKQAVTFSNNIDAMVNSTGTMDEAFKSASDNADAFGQLLKNNTAPLNDMIASITGGAAPILDFSASAGVTALSITQLSKALKFNGVIMKANGALTRVATGIMRRFSVTTHATGITVEATSRSIKLLKYALVGLGAGAVILALDAIANAFVSISSKTDEAKDKEEELRKENERWKQSLTDVSTAASEGAAKEMTALNKLYNTAKNEKKSKEERAQAVRDLQAQYPDYFKNIDAELINIGLLESGYLNLSTSILQAARARAIQKKIEENTGKQLDLEMQLEKEQKNVKDLTEAYDKAAEARKAAKEKQRTDEEDMGWFARSYTVMEPTSARIGDDEVAAAVERETRAREDLAAATAKETETDRELNAVKNANLDLEKKLADLPDRKPGAPKVTAAGTGVSAVPVVETNKALNAEAKTLREIENNITVLRKQLLDADATGAATINRQIAYWEEQRDAIHNAGKAIDENTEKQEENAKANTQINEYAVTLQDIEANISILNRQLETATADTAKNINKQIDKWTELADEIRNAGRETENTGKSIGKSMLDGWGAIKQVGGGVESITGALEGNGNAWQKVVGVIDGFISIYQGMQSVISIMQILTGLSDTHAVAKTAEGVVETSTAAARTVSAGESVAASAAVIATNKLETASFQQLAAAKYMAAHAGIPFAGFAIGAGFVTAMQALVTAAGIPKFAKGGIISGPTLAMVGEYGGAATNPEVIAPLDRLKSIIGGGTGGGVVKFEIQGRTLVGILEKENNLRRRS